MSNLTEKEIEIINKLTLALKAITIAVKALSEVAVIMGDGEESPKRPKLTLVPNKGEDNGQERD